MASGQGVEKALRAFQAALFRKTGGRIGGSLLGRPVLLLTTCGRRTGQPRTLPLVYLPLDDGSYLVAASNAGAIERDPDWLRNLRANPEVQIQVGRETQTRKAEVVDSAEREALWQRFSSAYSNFADYQRRASRQIPLVRLRPLAAPPPRCRTAQPAN